MAVLSVLSAIVAAEAGTLIVKALPAGRYPQLVLWLPSIGAGLLFFLLASVPIYARAHRQVAACRGEDSDRPAPG